MTMSSPYSVKIKFVDGICKGQVVTVPVGADEDGIQHLHPPNGYTVFVAYQMPALKLSSKPFTERAVIEAMKVSVYKYRVKNIFRTRYGTMIFSHSVLEYAGDV